MNFSIVQLIINIVLVVLFVGYYVIKAIKNKWLEKIMHTIEVAMAKAEEQYPQGHGEEKKQLVIEDVKMKCKELDIPYELIAKLISKLIDRIVKDYNLFK